MADSIQIQRHLEHAQGYLLLKMYDDALAEADAVLATHPDHKDGLYWKGMAYLEQRMLAEAEAPFRRLTEIDPEQAHVYVHLAYIYRRTVSMEKAVETIQRALALNPKLPVAVYNLACYHAVGGRPQDALKLLQQALTLESEYRELARTDPDFDSLRDNPEFQKLTQN